MKGCIDSTAHHTTVVDITLPVVAGYDSPLSVFIGSGEDFVLMGTGDFGEYESHEPGTRSMT